ncbi:hypothetical protein B0H19DRAFT_439905 [Mycena capillaripes]|nr:hypothetical protein B0H19DRAFT_439905 [Mycena capillaripes]
MVNSVVGRRPTAPSADPPRHHGTVPDFSPSSFCPHRLVLLRALRGCSRAMRNVCSNPSI